MMAWSHKFTCFSWGQGETAQSHNQDAAEAADTQEGAAEGGGPCCCEDCHEEATLAKSHD